MDEVKYSVFERNRVYKVTHITFTNSPSFDRDYIIFLPCKDVEYCISPKEEIHHLTIDCDFIVAFTKEIKCRRSKDDILRTGYDIFCKVETKFTNKDLCEINEACRKLGYKYNRKLGKIIR